jgi:UDP-N-acetyl-D-glucosamine/UDP-N-acetyl-D-galactosamine dehydrogenase
MHWKIDETIHVVVIGLGYVGLPTAMAFSEKYQTLGVDIDSNKILDLKSGIDNTCQFTKDQILNTKHLQFSEEIATNASKTVYIVTVPTPIRENKEPDLSFLEKASLAIGKQLKKGDVVIFESTTFPGCTEEVCIPILEKASKLHLNIDFGVGYSPERLSPGDSKPLSEIVRISSGSNEEVADFVNKFYQSVLNVPVYKAKSIKVAEAAKLVENCQRDVNISFVNELSVLFDKMGIDTSQVLEAAATKWNFQNFKPGLVGGHCISVDPYYMIHKAKEFDYNPAVIGAGRFVNESMGKFVAHKCLKLMNKKGISQPNAKAIILGFAYKSNCSDFRNTKVIDVYKELKEFGLEVDVVDDIVDSKKVYSTYKLDLKKMGDLNEYDLIIHAVPHSSFNGLYQGIKNRELKVIFDVTGAWPENFFDGSL